MRLRLVAPSSFFERKASAYPTGTLVEQGMFCRQASGCKSRLVWERFKSRHSSPSGAWCQVSATVRACAAQQSVSTPAKGKATSKQDPWPGSLCSLMAPPWALTICSLM